AVIGVMYHHFYERAGGVGWAALGVRLFFVLSGFLITGILLRCRDLAAASSGGRSRQLRLFYARRALRILPLAYVVVLAATFVNLPGMQETLPWHLRYTSNISFALHRDSSALSGHFWSLAVEEQFYLVWPCLILFLPYSKLPWTIAATIVVGTVS